MAGVVGGGPKYEVVTKAVVSPIISKHNWPPIVAMDNITGHSDSPYWFSS